MSIAFIVALAVQAPAMVILTMAAWNLRDASLDELSPVPEHLRSWPPLLSVALVVSLGLTLPGSVWLAAMMWAPAVLIMIRHVALPHRQVYTARHVDKVLLLLVVLAPASGFLPLWGHQILIMVAVINALFWMLSGDDRLTDPSRIDDGMSKRTRPVMLASMFAAVIAWAAYGALSSYTAPTWAVASGVATVVVTRFWHHASGTRLLKYHRNARVLAVYDAVWYRAHNLDAPVARESIEFLDDIIGPAGASPSPLEVEAVSHYFREWYLVTHAELRPLFAPQDAEFLRSFHHLRGIPDVWMLVDYVAQYSRHPWALWREIAARMVTSSADRGTPYLAGSPPYGSWDQIGQTQGHSDFRTAHQLVRKLDGTPAWPMDAKRPYSGLTADLRALVDRQFLVSVPLEKYLPHPVTLRYSTMTDWEGEVPGPPRHVWPEDDPFVSQVREQLTLTVTPIRPKVLT